MFSDGEAPTAPCLGDVGERAPDGQLDSLATTDRPESAS